jgi:type I restriction enzyme S subunit
LAIVDQSPDPVCGWTDDISARVNAPLPLVVFGDHTCVLKLVEHDFAQGADGIKIISAKSCIDIRFLFYALQADPIVSTSYRRHFSLLQQKQVGFPKDADEQHRIADCLASLDTRITAETARLAALKTHKQGLMQQLFPAPEVQGA